MHDRHAYEADAARPDSSSLLDRYRFSEALPASASASR